MLTGLPCITVLVVLRRMARFDTMWEPNATDLAMSHVHDGPAVRLRILCLGRDPRDDHGRVGNRTCEGAAMDNPSSPAGTLTIAEVAEATGASAEAVWRNLGLLSGPGDALIPEDIERVRLLSSSARGSGNRCATRATSPAFGDGWRSSAVAFIRQGMEEKLNAPQRRGRAVSRRSGGGRRRSHRGHSARSIP